jgi:uncharacterized protein (TIGR02118 family)
MSDDDVEEGIMRLPANRATAMSNTLSGKGNFSARHQDTKLFITQEVNMIRLAVLCPKSSESTFDMDYYLNKHVPMVVSRLAPMGLVKGEIDEGVAGLTPDQPALYMVIGCLMFQSIDDLQNGFATHGAEIMGDVPNFTNVQPIVQINRIAF